MSEKNHKQSWEEYRQQELEGGTLALDALGFTLEESQPHIGGERFLMQSVTTPHGRKLALLARQKNTNKRVFVKITSDPNGKRELRHEQTCKRVLEQINFAYGTFFSPKEVLVTEKGNLLIVIHDFIEQEKPFLKRSIEEQFNFALQAFKAQESAHATTHSHQRLVSNTFGSQNAENYIEAFLEFETNVLMQKINSNLKESFKKGRDLLEKNELTIEQYTGFLTHVDFVPHNFRIAEGKMYLLDHSSLRFGNKYEGWARFLNFMTLYNPPLTEALLQYVADNRTPEETHSLRLMRVYRLGEIIWYYTNTLSQSSGNLHTLNLERIRWWAHVLESILAENAIDEKIRTQYTTKRDALRDEEEEKRQIELH